MADLQFDYGKADAAAKKIKRCGDTASSAIVDAGKEINNLTGWWKGETSISYKNQFDELKPNMEKLGQLLTQIATQLESISTQKKQMESDLARKIGVR